MQKREYIVGQSLRQVQQFLTVHADAVPSAVASAAKQELDTAVATLDEAAIEQGSLTRRVRGEVRRREQLERILQRKYMTPLAKYARASLRGVPQFAALTPSARALRAERLVRTAQAMAVAAEQYVDQLEEAEFPADFLERLRTAAAAVQRSFDAGVSGRVRRTGVTKEIRAALASGRRAVARLDALMGHTILGDEALEREWRAAKLIRRRGTAARERSEAVAGTIAPATGASVAQDLELRAAA
jgi:uncharacterized protein YaiL (DUF2058 family)